MRFLVLLLTFAGVLAAAVPAAADPPDGRHVQDVFVDIDPCTGLAHLVTVDVTIYDHGASSHGSATIATSLGYVGRGEETDALFDSVFVLNHMLVNPQTGERIRAQLIFVGEPGGDPEDARVFRSKVECVGGVRP